MNLTFVLLLISAFIFADTQSRAGSIQNLSIQWTVAPGMQEVEGSGLCIDQKCSVIATVFHIEMVEEWKAELEPSINYLHEWTENGSSIIPELSAIPTEVPYAVSKLISGSAAASKRMVNLVTKQCLEQNTRKSLCHELSIVNGVQTFREISSNGKLGKPHINFPIQNQGVWTQSDWADTLAEIAESEWTFRGAQGQYYVFSSRSVANDERCYWHEHSSPLFGGTYRGWEGPVACQEWVLTDKDLNVMSVFTEMYPPKNCLTRLVQTAMVYDWVELDDMNSPMLLPVSERISATVLGQKRPLSSTVSWTNYRAFRSEHKLKF